MEPEPAEVENLNFRYFHHNFRCESVSQDVFHQASLRRKSLAQCYQASLSLCDTVGTCQIIESRFKSYHTLVDDRAEKSVNNYADAALQIASSAGKSVATKWKSNLRSRTVSSVVEKLTGCPGKCSTIDVDEQDLKIFAQTQAHGNQDKKTLLRGQFIPKSAGIFQPAFGLAREQNQGKLSDRGSSSSAVIYSNQANPKNLSRGNSFDNSVSGDGASSNSGFDKWHTHTSPLSNVAEGPSRSSSDEFGADGGGTYGKRGMAPVGVFNQGSSNFGMPGAVNSRTMDDPFKGDFNAGAKTGQFRGGPMMDNSTTRWTNPSSNSNAWNRNPNQGPLKKNQNAQPDVGMSSVSASIFKTARDELVIQNQKKYGGRGGNNNGYPSGRGGIGVQKRSLGTSRRAGVHGKFVPPIKPTDEDDFGGMFGVKQPGIDMEDETGEETDERLKNIDPKMVETIRNEIMDIGAPVEWDDIAGLDFAKKTIQEIVVWPLLRPDIFTGLRKPPKGLLLFGPPGTGKTLIGKCIASQSQSTFFSISASSLTSKWIGDGEKMVRALFAVAKVHQPSVVFIDEIDSLLTQRSDTEHESSRRIKTEFLVQLDGAGTGEEERILVVGATNRPQELDEAARRRLVKRLYIPLPEISARRQIVERLMLSERNTLTNKDIDEIASLTDGYSGADMKNLCQEASLGPIRSISFSAMHQITPDQVRPITVEDFKNALQRVRASVSNKDLDAYVQWDKTYGMGSGA